MLHSRPRTRSCHAGIVKAASTSDSRARWPVRTASYHCLRDNSLVSNCRQRQLCMIFACMYEMHGSSATEATEIIHPVYVWYSIDTILGYQSSSWNETALHR